MSVDNSATLPPPIESVLRDILFMYKVFTDYGGIFEDLGPDGGSYNPLAFIDFKGSEMLSEEDTRLIQVGASLRLLSSVLEAWAQHSYPKAKVPLVESIRQALNSGRFQHLPDIQTSLQKALETSDYNSIGCNSLYKKYVLGFFNVLAQQDELIR